MNPNPIRQQITKRRIITGAVALAVMAVLYVGMSWYVVAEALKADVVEFAYHPDDLGLTYEDVEFHPRGEEEITLRGWWLPADDAVASIIWVHGLDENRAEQLPMLYELIDAGFSILAFDLRGHGKSDIVPLGAGYKEPADVRGAIDFLLTSKGVASGEVLLMGRSFGAAIVLMAGVGEPAVVGVYADSPFASVTDMLIGEIERRTPFPSWLASLLRPGIVQVGEMKGIKLDEVSPEVAVAGYTDYVVGIAHCREDERIPFEHSVRIRFNSEPGIWFNLYPGCGHTEAYDDFSESFVGTVIDYFLEQLELREAQQ
jgi:pimeloyl-ACP methyl ester carboxylesterase